jgi:5-methylcytosine-specific restriction enzyme subunit McrC
MANRIPVQNLYYLLLYAWNRLPEGQAINVAGIRSPELPNLIAKVLLEGTRNLLRRGLDRNYVETDEDLTRPRGRVRISDTLNRALRSRAQIACTTDELSRDVLANQILKATLERLAKTEEIDQSLRNGMTAILSGLSEIRSIALVARDFGRVQLHGNNAGYAFLLRVCALAHEALLPDQRTGRFRFRNVLANPQAMGLIFQDFIRNFFRLEQDRFDVKGDQVRWDVDRSVGSGHHLLPAMFTDTSLSDGRRTIIVECKWTSALEIGRGGKRTLNEDHLRQLHTYMIHHARTLSHVGSVEGLLLYPLTDENLNVDLMVKGQRFRVRTINFAVDWQEIRMQLLDLLQDVPLMVRPSAAGALAII